ncbi:MAG: hypothetical protein MJ131_04970 [Lachnospiraceae bacterium]|nr:hypothetical protein [Lachnospiraceae bacterium]
MTDSLKNFILVTGHYGCGKTNFSINLAMDFLKKGRKVTMVDMDLVNPYFRTSDYRELLESKGIEVIAPVFGHTNLDLPSLPAAMYSIFDSKDLVICDVGGDDVGATVLGRFRPQFANFEYDMLYLVNHFRNMTSEPEEAVQILREIEAVSGLKANKIVNNSHLMYDTDEEVLLSGKAYAQKVAGILGIEVFCNTVKRELLDKGTIADTLKPVYPVDIYVKPQW